MTRAHVVAWHELRRPSFLIAAFVMPLVTAAFWAAIGLTVTQIEVPRDPIGVVDPSGTLVPPTGGRFRAFVDEAEGRAALLDGSIHDLVVAADDFPTTGDVTVYQREDGAYPPIPSGVPGEMLARGLLSRWAPPDLVERALSSDLGEVDEVLLDARGEVVPPDVGRRLADLVPAAISGVLVLGLFTASGALLLSVAVGQGGGARGGLRDPARRPARP